MLLLMLLGAAAPTIIGVRAYASVSYSLADSADISYTLNNTATNTEANTTNATATED